MTLDCSAYAAYMQHMKRISLSLPGRLLALLQRDAKRLGITVGELLRRLLDERYEAQK